MFLLNSLQPGSLRRCIMRSVFALFVVSCLSATLLLTSCNTEADDSGNLNGTWENVYVDPSGEEPDYITTIKINTSAKTVIFQGSYEGTIANSYNYEAKSGVLIVKFTKYADWGSEPSSTHANVGKYGALYWTALTATSVSLSDAYVGFDHVMFDTLTEANAQFTLDNAGDYVNWSWTSPYTKK